MIVYRLSKNEYHLDLSGKGAELYGGRWNSQGVPMVYTSQSQALAFAEVAVHIPVGIIPKDYVLVAIRIPDTASIFQLNIADLPPDWRSNPPSHNTQLIGDKFITESKHLILQVPSAVVPGDFNFLVNPRHAGIKKVVIVSAEPFEFDSRIVGR